MGPQQHELFPLNSLPQDCLSVVLSHCSPRDICRLSCVNSTWKQAGESEAAWRLILPWRHMLDSHFPILKASENARVAFDRVLDGVLSSDKKFLLKADQVTGRISLHASVADNLDITWFDKARETGYWTLRNNVDGADFDSCAYLIRVCWFQISGLLKTDIGLPPGKYRISWKVGKCPTQFVWSRFPANCTVALTGQHKALQDVKVDFGRPGRECISRHKKSKGEASAGPSGPPPSSVPASSSSPGASWFWGSSGTSSSSSSGTQDNSSSNNVNQASSSSQSQAPATTPGATLPPTGDVVDSFDIPWWLKPVARWGFNQMLSALENAEVVEVVTEHGRPTMRNPQGRPGGEQAGAVRTVWHPDPERPMTGIDVLQQMLHDAQYSLAQAQAQQADNPEAARSIPALQQTLGNIQGEINARRMQAESRRARTAAASSSRPGQSSSQVVYSAGEHGASFQFRWSSGGRTDQGSQAQTQTQTQTQTQAQTPEQAGGTNQGSAEDGSNPFMQLLGGIGSFFGGSSSATPPPFDRNAVRWEEFDVGEVVLEDQEGGLCKFDADVSLSETVTGGWKSGLYVDSIIITQCDD